MTKIRPLTMPEPEAGLENILQSPKNEGRLDLIVRRPQSNQHDILASGKLNPGESCFV